MGTSWHFQNRFKLAPKVPNIQWVNAYCFQVRSEPTPPDIREYDVERKEIWTRSMAFMVPRGKADDFVEWVLTGEYSDEHWPSSMPDFGGSNGAFLGEYAWAPAFEQSGSSQAMNAHEWRHPKGSEPTIAYGLAAHCTTAGGEYDCSADKNAVTTLYLPSHLIVRDCQLTWTGVGADHIDANSRMAAFDPSAHEPGPNALLLRLDVLERHLSGNDLELCWAVPVKNSPWERPGNRTVGFNFMQRTYGGATNQKEDLTGFTMPRRPEW